MTRIILIIVKKLMKNLIILDKHFIQIPQNYNDKVIQTAKNRMREAKPALIVGNLLDTGCYNTIIDSEYTAKIFFRKTKRMILLTGVDI